MNLVQAGKISTSTARDLLVRCVNASRLVRELEQYEVELEKEVVKLAIGRPLAKQEAEEAEVCAAVRGASAPLQVPRVVGQDGFGAELVRAWQGCSESVT